MAQPYKKGTFLTNIPNKQIILRLRGAPLNLYLALCDHADKEGQCWPSYAKLATDTGYTERALKEAIHELISAGLITKEHQNRQNGRQTSNTYQIMVVDTPDGPVYKSSETMNHSSRFQRRGEPQDTHPREPRNTPMGVKSKTPHINSPILTHPISNSPNTASYDAGKPGGIATVDNSLKREKEYGKPEINELFRYWEQVTGTPMLARVQLNRNACETLIRKCGVEGVRRLIDGVALTLNDRYAPQIANFIDLLEKLDKLTAWGKRYQARQMPRPNPAYVI